MRSNFGVLYIIPDQLSGGYMPKSVAAQQLAKLARATGGSPGMHTLDRSESIDRWIRVHRALRAVIWMPARLHRGVFTSMKSLSFWLLYMSARGCSLTHEVSTLRDKPCTYTTLLATSYSYPWHLHTEPCKFVAGTDQALLTLFPSSLSRARAAKYDAVVFIIHDYSIY